METKVYAYTIFRLGIGISLLGHGFIRLFKMRVFSNWMLNQFGTSMLPTALVLPFSYLLPVLEFLVGLLSILGLLTRQALVLGSIIMLVLLFGTTMIENWDALPSQLIHLAYFSTLLWLYSPENNRVSLDHLLKKK